MCFGVPILEIVLRVCKRLATWASHSRICRESTVMKNQIEILNEFIFHNYPQLTTPIRVLRPPFSIVNGPRKKHNCFLVIIASMHTG